MNQGVEQMGRFFGLVMVLAIVGGGGYLYMHQAESATVAGASDPEATVDIVGVKRDLMSIARAERVHMGLYGRYAPMEELRSSGDLTMQRDSRGPYSYSVEVSASTFRATATYSGPSNPSASRTISLDQDLRFSQQ